MTDTDRDGVFDQVHTFADGLNIPVGITPASRGVLAYSIPSINRYMDLDGDARADRRETVFTGFGHADTHGMPNGFVWWIDGWVYACHGEGNTSVVAGTDGSTVTLRGGNTFRFRPDGSRIEHFTRGQVNPFGLCFDPLGNAYSADSHSRPATMLLRGAWYPGFVDATHDGLGFAPPIMQHYHGSTGIAGIAYYAADQFPAEYRDTLFIGNPVTGRINRDRLEVHGSTYRAIEQPDFLTCADPWFRPVDVRLGPDGALYIADFYNRIIGHSEVPFSHAERDHERGRIWRVVYKGSTAAGTRAGRIPDLTGATSGELIDYLRDPNLMVRTLATHELTERIAHAAIDPIQNLIGTDSHPWQRAHGLWVLHRLGTLDERSIQVLSNDPDRTVRAQLVKALAEQNDWGSDGSIVQRLVMGKLTDPDAFVRRAAAEALARHSSGANIDPLLRLWSITPADDALLIHTVRIALRDNLRDLGNIIQIADRFANDPGDRRRLADVSLGIRTSAAASCVLRFLREGPVQPARLGEFVHHAVRYSDASSLPGLYSYFQTYREETESAQRMVLRALYRAAQERTAKLPKEVRQWGIELARGLLASADERSVYSGIELAWDLQLTDLAGELKKLAGRSSPFQELRSFAIDALGAVDDTGAVSVLHAMLGDPTEPTEIREKAADALGKMNDSGVRAVLVTHLSTAPAQVATVIAQHLAHSREGGESLLETVSEGKASAHLLQDAVVDQRLRDVKLPDIEAQLAKLRAGLPPRDDRIRQMIGERREQIASGHTNPARGQQVIEKHCAICHQIGGKGTKVGPQLDAIGARGLDRLLEDILDPNRNVDRSYRSTIIALTNGRVLTGLVLREESNLLMLADSEGKTHEIQLGQIAERRSSSLSPMPSNAVDRISESDLCDIVGYLLESRTEAQSPKHQ